MLNGIEEGWLETEEVRERDRGNHEKRLKSVVKTLSVAAWALYQLIFLVFDNFDITVSCRGVRERVHSHCSSSILRTPGPSSPDPSTLTVAVSRLFRE